MAQASKQASRQAGRQTGRQAQGGRAASRCALKGREQLVTGLGFWIAIETFDRCDFYL